MCRGRQLPGSPIAAGTPAVSTEQHTHHSGSKLEAHHSLSERSLEQDGHRGRRLRVLRLAQDSPTHQKAETVPGSYHHHL